MQSAGTTDQDEKWGSWKGKETARSIESKNSRESQTGKEKKKNSEKKGEWVKNKKIKKKIKKKVVWEGFWEKTEDRKSKK